MKENRVILLIENQIEQYKNIKKYLNREGFTVYPTEENYIEFIDLIRIFLNNRYGGTENNTRRRKAFDEIINKLREYSPDFLFIDYKLIGNSDSENGYFLAKKFRIWAQIKTPILFLSKVNKNQESILNDIETNEVQPFVWATKGYAGQDINYKEYIKNVIVDIYLKKLSSHQHLNSLSKLIPKLELLRQEEHELHNKITSIIENEKKGDYISAKLTKAIASIEKFDESEFLDLKQAKLFIQNYEKH